MLAPLLLLAAVGGLVLFGKSRQNDVDAGNAPVAMGQILKEAVLFDGKTPAQVGPTYVVELGDYPAFIAKKVTGAPSRWPELVAANPDKPRAASGSFRTLQPGEVLYLPAAWASPIAPEATPPVKNTPPPPTGGGTSEPSASETSIVSSLPDASLLAYKGDLLDWTKREGFAAYAPEDIAAADWTARDAEATRAFKNSLQKKLLDQSAKGGAAAPFLFADSGKLTSATYRAMSAYGIDHGRAALPPLEDASAPTTPAAEVETSIVNDLSADDTRSLKAQLLDWAKREGYPASDYGGVDTTTNDWTDRDANVTKAFKAYFNAEDAKASKPPTFPVPVTPTMTTRTVQALWVYAMSHGGESI